MAVIFDYSQILQNAALLNAESSGRYTSPPITNSSSHTFFESLINPGHQNDADVLEYSFRFLVSGDGGVYAWKFQPRGSTVWDTLASTTAPAWPAVTILNGVYDTSSIALPCRIRLVGTSTGTVTIVFGNSTTINMIVGNTTHYMNTVRVTGSVAT